MTEDPERAHNFNEALKGYGLDLETLRAIIAAVKEHYEQTGSFPSATQLRALIVRPGL